MKRFSSKRIALKEDVLSDRKYTVCRRVRACFSPEVLRARAVKGLNNRYKVENEMSDTYLLLVQLFCYILLSPVLGLEEMLA